jgi:sugar/nucleoside kinase (ribokinase family)
MNKVNEKIGLTCLGAGTFPLDNLMIKHSKDDVETIYQHVGGTCGNVMSILGMYGWHALPAARLDDSEVGFQLKADLESYGCDTRYLTNTPDGGTTILDIIHKTGRDGKPKTAYMAHSPRGGRFVNHRFWTLKQAQSLFDSLDQMPDVFFFDRCAPGNILLAELLHERGVMVYYEPNEPVDRNFLRAVAASDIVKFSNERHPDVSFTDGFTDKFFIQTMNQEGLRYRLRDGEWKQLAPVLNPNAIDGEGAGDWTSSTFINALGKHGLTQVSDLEESVLKECLMEAQRVASESVSYIGAKGLIHH